MLWWAKALLVTPRSWPARFMRWLHQLGLVFRPWRWRDHPPCCALTSYYAGPPNWRLQVTQVGCTCGRDFLE